MDNEILDYNIGRYVVCLDNLHVAIQERNLDCMQVKDVGKMKIKFRSNDFFENYDQGGFVIFSRLSNQPIMNYMAGTIALENEGCLEEFKYRKDTFNCFNRVLN